MKKVYRAVGMGRRGDACVARPCPPCGEGIVSFCPFPSPAKMNVKSESFQSIYVFYEKTIEQFR
jgi:hypothetical protein